MQPSGYTSAPDPPSHSRSRHPYRRKAVTRAEADHEHELGADDFVALVASWSWIANLPDERRANVLAGVRELLADQRSLTLRYRTEICSTRVA